jgi:hypothetical protein
MLRLLQRGSDPPGPTVDPATRVERESEHGAGGGRWHRCRACRTRLARESDEIAVGGEVLHAAINPAGYYHVFVTVGRCENVRSVGEPTLEATWFPGCAWQVLACGGCDAQLGWRWLAAAEAGAPSPFYGLRVDALAGDDQDEAQPN